MLLADKVHDPPHQDSCFSRARSGIDQQMLIEWMANSFPLRRLFGIPEFLEELYRFRCAKLFLHLRDDAGRGLAISVPV